ncbi:MAG: hypothetical protein EOM11_01140 [Erysipelotrichia bacterium]|nr:hypothetical protein [Erysipelotrichia bacterium]
MKKQKGLKFVVAMLLCLPLLSLSACSSKPDGVSLLEEAQASMQKVKSVHMDMTFDMAMKIGMGGGSIKSSTTMNMGIDMTVSPFAYHGNMDMSVKTIGVDETNESEIYAMEGSEGFVQYVKENGVWSQSYEENPLNNIQELYQLDKKLLKKLNPKVKGTTKINGKDTYEVMLSVDQETMKMYMEKFNGAFTMPEMEEEEWQKFKITYSVFIDKQSKRYVQMKMPLMDSANLFMDSMLSTSDEMKGTEISFEQAEIVLNFSKYNKIDEIVVPEEVKAMADADADIDENVVEGDISTQTHAWENCQVIIDGTQIVLKESSLQSLLDAGYTIDESFEKVEEKIEKFGYAYLTLLKDDDELYVSLDNLSEKDILLKDGIISSISTNTSSKAHSLPANISIGSSKQDVLVAYGQANLMDTSYQEMWEYENDDDQYKTLNLYFEEDRLVSFSIGCY